MIRVGLLSTAAINEALLGGARESELVEVIGVASRERERAEAYAREKGLERAYGGYDELLADPDLDVVYVALPNALHVEWAIRALEAGKHVLSEKPLSRRPSEVERAFDAAERAGRILIEGFMYRHHPQTKRFAQLVSDGEIGELRLVRSQFSFTLDRPHDVRWDRELGGGSLLDLGCYCTNLMRHLAGQPERVYAEQTLAPSGVDLRFAAALRFRNGVLGHFDCAFDLPRRVRFEAVGSDGSATILQPFAQDEVTLEVRRGAELVSSETVTANRYHLELDNLARAIEGEEPPLLDRRESVAQAVALEALLRSAESGHPTSLVSPQDTRNEGA
jgi:D-xylose 1-dehydrogenase (NADP+, D-xylono-1,5-lactone-forming)